MTERQTSRLYYHGTAEEVRLGDRVRMRRFLRGAVEGVVCYIPGLSARHNELEFEDVKQWAIRSADGNVYPILYDPEGFQPPKDITFIARGHEGLLSPQENLE